MSDAPSNDFLAEPIVIFLAVVNLLADKTFLVESAVLSTLLRPTLDFDNAGISASTSVLNVAFPSDPLGAASIVFFVRVP